MRDRLIILIIGLLFGQSLMSQTAYDLTMESAIEVAMDESRTVKNAYIGVRDADAQVKERRAIGLPQVSAAFGYQYLPILPKSILPAELVPDPNASREVAFGQPQALSGSIDANMLIFDYSYLTALKAAKEYEHYAQEDLALKKQTVSYQVADAYLPNLLIGEVVDVLDKNISVIQKMLDETRAMYQAGFVEQLDVDRIQLAMNNLTATKQSFLQQEKTTRIALRFAIGVDMDSEITINETIDELIEKYSVEAVDTSFSFAARPEFRLAESGLKLQTLNLKAQKAAYYPNVAAFGQYQSQLQGQTLFNDVFHLPSMVLGVNVNVPIFTGLGTQAKVERAQLDLETRINDKQDLERSIELQVQSAHAEITRAQLNLDNMMANEALAQRIFDTATIKYKEGVGSSIELDQVEQSLYENQQNVIQAKYDLLSAYIALRKALGQTL